MFYLIKVISSLSSSLCHESYNKLKRVISIKNDNKLLNLSITNYLFNTDGHTFAII
jgi:hypothetical protein